MKLDDTKVMNYIKQGKISLEAVEGIIQTKETSYISRVSSLKLKEEEE